MTRISEVEMQLSDCADYARRHALAAIGRLALRRAVDPHGLTGSARGGPWSLRQSRTATALELPWEVDSIASPTA